MAQRMVGVVVSLLLLGLGVQAGHAQVRQITGRVTNAQTEQGVSEATIAVLGTQIVAQADNDGRYTLNAPAGRREPRGPRPSGTSGNRSPVRRRPAYGGRGPRAGRLQAGRDRHHRSGHRRRAAEPAQRRLDRERRRADPRADGDARERAAGQDSGRHYPGQLRRAGRRHPGQPARRLDHQRRHRAARTWWTASW